MQCGDTCDCGPVDERWLVTDRSSGDIVCTQCGVVVEGHTLDLGPEWRPCDGDLACRATPLADDGLLPARHATLLCQAGKPVWSKLTAERDPLDSVRKAFVHIANQGRTMGFTPSSHVTVQAKELYRDLHAVKPVRGDVTRDAHVAAALYLACKLCGAFRELRHVSAACGVDGTLLNDAVAAFKDRLSDRPYHDRLFEAVQPGGLLNMYADRLDVPDCDLRRIKRSAHALDAELEGVLDCSRAPRTICSGVLWMAAAREGVHMPKRTVMAACGVCQQSVAKVVAELERALRPSTEPHPAASACCV